MTDTSSATPRSEGRPRAGRPPTAAAPDDATAAGQRSREARERLLLTAERLYAEQDDRHPPDVRAHGGRDLRGRPGRAARPGGTRSVREPHLHDPDRRADHTESAEVLGLLYQHMTSLEHTCRFRWQPGSVAFWDNRATAHLVPTDHGKAGLDRVMHRITVTGDVPVGVDGARSGPELPDLTLSFRAGRCGRRRPASNGPAGHPPVPAGRRRSAGCRRGRAARRGAAATGGARPEPSAGHPSGPG